MDIQSPFFFSSIAIFRLALGKNNKLARSVLANSSSIWQSQVSRLNKEIPRIQYPYEIELDEKANLNYQFNLQKLEEERKKEEKIQPFNLYAPSHRVVYMSERLKKTVDPMIGILADMIKIEIDCENLRLDLCMQPEFQIHKLYDIFYSIPLNLKDHDGVTVEEFAKGVKGFGIQADIQDIELLMTKHQAMNFKRRKQEIYMDYYDFHNLFMALSQEKLFVDKMKKTSNMKGDPNIGRKFSVITNYYIDHLLRLMISQEQTYEKMRRQIQALDIDLQAMFSYMNQASADEDIKVANFNRFFREHGILFQDCEVQLIAFRMTKRITKEEISLKEFVRELTPRLLLHADVEADQLSQEQQKERDLEYEQYMTKKTQTSLFDKKTKASLY